MPEAPKARQVLVQGQEGAFYGQEGAASRARQVRFVVKKVAAELMDGVGRLLRWAGFAWKGQLVVWFWANGFFGIPDDFKLSAVTAFADVHALGD